MFYKLIILTSLFHTTVLAHPLLKSLYDTVPQEQIGCVNVDNTHQGGTIAQNCPNGGHLVTPFPVGEGQAPSTLVCNQRTPQDPEKARARIEALLVNLPPCERGVVEGLITVSKVIDTETSKPGDPDWWYELETHCRNCLVEKYRGGIELDQAIELCKELSQCMDL